MALTEAQQDLCTAIEHEDLDRLLGLLREGVSLDFLVDGFSPLHLALDVESDNVAQNGGPMHVDVTAVLLCFGAHPDDTFGGQLKVTARHTAFLTHELAFRLFELIYPEQQQ